MTGSKAERGVAVHGRIAMDGLTSANLASGLTRVAVASAEGRRSLTGANLQSGLRPAGSATSTSASTATAQGGATTPAAGSKK